MGMQVKKLAGVSYIFRAWVLLLEELVESMSNRLKRDLALAGISSRCYTVDDMEMVEQFKNTAKYRKWKEEKERKRMSLSKRKGKWKAAEEVYGDYTPSYMKLKVNGKPRLRV